jgi:hypothetical protein
MAILLAKAFFARMGMLRPLKDALEDSELTPQEILP